MKIINGSELIAQERRRQIDVEGWSAEHDAQHTRGELAWAAVCYAAPELVYVKRNLAGSFHFDDPWPFEQKWDKRPHPEGSNYVYPNTPLYLNREERIRELVKAGALIAAEIDRLIVNCESE